MTYLECERSYRCTEYTEEEEEDHNVNLVLVLYKPHMRAIEKSGKSGRRGNNVA
jgi:hypothetical protein